MRVQDVLTFDEYWRRYPSKRPSPESQVTRCGDNIYHGDARGNLVTERGAFHDEHSREHDLSGKNVLISSVFYYFGRDAIPIPEEYHCIIKSEPGCKNTFDKRLIDRFWNWVAGQCPRMGRIGLPYEFEDSEGREVRPPKTGHIASPRLTNSKQAADFVKVVEAKSKHRNRRNSCP
jgi:hypothetical protein